MPRKDPRLVDHKEIPVAQIRWIFQEVETDAFVRHAVFLVRERNRGREKTQIKPKVHYQPSRTQHDRRPLRALASNLHRFLFKRYEDEIPSSYYGAVGNLTSHLPANPALQALPSALVLAHAHNGKPRAVIVFVIQPNETNSVDQRCLEYTLWETHRVKVLRRSLHEIAKAELRGPQRELWIDCAEVAVAYFRSHTRPPTTPGCEVEWMGRTTVERSLAIARTKQLQQVLAQPAQLRRFMTESENVVLEKCFTGLWLGTNVPGFASVGLVQN
ncbi:Aste57867_23847 [Aphanomyces stellatus]|uniref:Aste57867_23847 protein n=1 Tax=Aphanomyces stellatus TaxID=120398 RepID=A0A485LNX0_9STRA|nr:hypothetical protein As57867_023774 [Aphanomyces stellatus]VFU00490.1 Aste57867_23847 [Aphanomyces stellatus]